MFQKDRVVSAILEARSALDQAMEELDRVPGYSADAVAFSAHALNNYLTVAGGTVDLLLITLANYPDPQVKVWLDSLRHATDVMAHTVSQLGSGYARADAPLRIETFQLPLLVQRLCTYYMKVAGRKGIALQSGTASEVPSIRADRVAVAAVLDNLLSNAVKYSARGTRIWVEVRADGDHVVCGVRDQGPGLSAEDQARLFQRGARLTPVPTAGEPSTGYGLAVAKELIDRLGGKLWCESLVGVGSWFAFSLPAQPSRGEQHPPWETEPREGV